MLLRRLSTGARGPLRASLSEQGITLSSMHSGFTVKSIQPIAEFDITLVELEHGKTGATLLHVDTSDTNNAFGVCFRTPAKESTGVAHILEHIVLCGSERFPVRDPFFKMLKRSMNTFMNAMTAGDFTVYPFSTVVPSDYDNLLQVYLDACFFPLLRKTDFMQEGHRLEVVVDEETHQQRLKRAGVVFNEMKGHLSSSSSLFGVEVSAQLFGSESIYGQVSGGDWKVIPDLTHERLVDFHKTKYHPSNSLFVTYGDLPLGKTLDTIDSRVLQRFSYSHDSDSDVGRKLVKAWTISEFDSTNVDRVFEASIVSELLLEGASAPLYGKLIESQIAPRFAPGVGLDPSSFYPSCAVGASGVSEENLSKVEAAILDGLELAVKEGFPAQRVDSILHQMELGRRHKRTDFGLTCIQSASSTWVHGGKLQDALDFTGPISRFKLALGANPRLLQDLAGSLFRDKFTSEQTVRVVATPTPTFSVQEAEVPITSLQQVEEITKLNHELAVERDMVEDLSVLPTLTVSNDVSRAYADPLPEIRHSQLGQQVLGQKTNGVSYLRGKFPVSRPNPLLPLLCAFVGDVDAGARSYKELDTALERYSGTLSVSPSFPIWLEDHSERPESHFVGSEERVKRLGTLLHTRSESMKAGLSRSCPRYANSKCMAAFGPQYQVQDAYSGFAQYEFVQAQAQREDKSALAGELQQLFHETFAHPELSLCSDADVSPAVEQFLGRFSNAPVPTNTASSLSLTPSPRASYLALPVPVHYCHAVVQTPVRFGHEDDAAMLVLSRLASYDFLHQQVREKGGAYGSGCSLDNSGFLAFSSFWDPHSTQTLQVFDQCLAWLCEANFTEKQVDEALLSVFAALDAPQNVSSKGLGQFRHGTTQAMKDRQRDKLFDLVGQQGVGKLRTVARRHLQSVDSFLQGTSSSTSSSVCIAGKKDTSEDFAKRGFQVVLA
ncbi:hypothetical protein BASA81_003009 [Batrachochytrium salamandrivorans]|nr:hypothetical protein BASA81_003009 [Batrachochytrium salamandrivorans]